MFLLGFFVLALVSVPLAGGKLMALANLELRRNRVIVRSTIELARNLGMLVVAEGVEEPRLWQELRSLGCDVAQGFGISQPMPAAAVRHWLAAIESGGLPILDEAFADAA